MARPGGVYNVASGVGVIKYRSLPSAQGIESRTSEAVLSRSKAFLALSSSAGVGLDTVSPFPRIAGGAFEYRRKNSTRWGDLLYAIGSVTIVPDLSHRRIRAVSCEIRME